MQKKIVSFRLKKESLILDVLPMTKHGWNVVPFVKHPYEVSDICVVHNFNHFRLAL